MKHIFPLLLLLALPLLAREPVVVHGHSYPATQEAFDLAWTLRGAEHFRYRLFSVFTGALYEAPQPGARRLTFTYTRSLKGDVLREQALRVLKGAHDAATLQRWAEPLATFNNAFIDVKPGDQYVLTVIPGRGVWLHLNGKEKSFLPDSDFGSWYLSIWLGDKPMSVPLRDALLKPVTP
jgi:hypothetical protein